MSKLIFEAADVRRVVEHSINAPGQGEIADWAGANEKNGFTPKTVVPEEPTITIVHDQGVYLMSNGRPRDVVEGERSFVAYAKGCDPKKDEDWWDNARDLVGGDDFGEHVPWAREIKQMLDGGATHIVVNFSRNRMSLSAKYAKGKAPKGELVPETEDQMLKRVQRLMKRKVVALDTDRETLTQFKCEPRAEYISAIKKKHPQLRVLNGLPPYEVRNAVRVHQAAARRARLSCAA